ncbi:Mu-NS [Balamuthia mandrillaris]
MQQKPDHFGDILAPREIATTLPEGYNGLERIVLAANGNLQRIMSAYYNSKVTVQILKSERRAGESNVYDRDVNLLCKGKIFCNAKSVVTLQKKEHLELIEENKVGLGQLFFYLRLLPSFELHHTARGAPDSNMLMLRDYTLSADGIVCDIHEEFTKDMFDL